MAKKVNIRINSLNICIETGVFLYYDTGECVGNEEQCKCNSSASGTVAREFPVDPANGFQRCSGEGLQ